MVLNNIVGILIRLVCSACSVAIIVLVSVPVLFAQQQEKGALYGLVVGVQKYNDSKLNRLSIQGTTELYDFLAERKRNFSSVRVALLTDEKATKENILKAWTQELDQARPEDVVIIFLDGHGGVSPDHPGEYYFTPYDAGPDMAATSVRVSDKNLFKNIRSERLLLLTGSCFSGGFLSGLARGRAPGASVDFFRELSGRFGISAAKDNEAAWVPPKFGMNVFTFFVVKGLRGAADKSGDGQITIKELYDYVSDMVRRETQGVQHPQLFMSKTDAAATTIYTVPTYSKKLEVDVKFFYETDDNRTKLLADGAVLKSGQHVGVAFKPDADCYVHILWWDSSGQVGRLFPNPKLTEGTGFVKGGEVCWLPSRKEGRHWYVLDDKPGQETIYFVATRERNPKLEELYEQLKGMSSQARGGERGAKVAEEIEREINLMGFADYTVPVKAREASFQNKEKLFEQLESKMKVAGVEAFVKLNFKHESR